MRTAGPIAGFHRSARLLALVAMVLYQPLAAFHAATDEAHVAGATTSLHVAHAGHGHGAFGGTPDSHQHPTHGDALCEFCLFSGAALAPLLAVTLHGPAWSLPHHRMAVDTVRPRERRHAANPVRAPPPAA